MKKEDIGHFIRAIGIGVFQFLLWMVIFELSTWIILQYHKPRRLSSANGVGYHYFILLIWIVFGIVMTGANLLGLYLKGRRSILYLYSALGIIYITCFFYWLDHHPYRAMHIITTGLLAMLCGEPLLNYLKIKKTYSNSDYIT